MLLNKGEAILCNSRSEALQLAKRLSEEGYEMFTSRWGSIAGVVGAHIGKIKNGNFGVRWMHEYEYPKCVALVTSEFAKELKATGKITCDDNIREFSWRWADFVLNGVVAHVEDLL